ncbi:MAG: hypothetical protein DWG83_02475 [Chloroflexi bacterium]|nr:hypothetical protein [Chloroflexota bacterium]
MTLELLVVALYRILGSLPVLRWAFAGGVIAVLIDLGDLFVIAGLDLGGVRNYQAADKWLDQVYLALFLVVALRWRALPGAIAVTLYLYRLAGFAIFEATGERWVLLAFPNVFEFWFLYVAATLWHARRRGLTAPSISPRHAAIALVPLTLAKLAHEWFVHINRTLDRYAPAEFFEALFTWLGLA